MMFIYDSDEFVNLNKVLIFNMVRRSVCVCFFITGFHSLIMASTIEVIASTSYKIGCISDL
jgi:hypothetical protein